MLESVVGFRGAPFASAPDPHCWAPLAGQQQAFESLVHCLHSGRGIAILTAPAGTGKSLLCQRIAEHVQKHFRVAYLPGGRFDGIPPLLQAVLFELGRPYQRMGAQELRLQLTTALREFRREGQGTVLILDEAHACGEDVLEEVRAATNLCQDGRPLLRVLLSGQYALEEMLTSPRLDALNQRIGCHVSLEPLTRSESAEFIAYRLRHAGGDPHDDIAPQALQTICYAAGGNPRCLNRLCDRSFELAAAAGRKPLDDAIVRLALDELKRLPLHWNDPPPAAAGPQNDLQELAVNAVSRVSPAASRETVFDDQQAGKTAVIEFGGDAPTAGDETTVAALDGTAATHPSTVAAASKPVSMVPELVGPGSRDAGETREGIATAGRAAEPRPDSPRDDEGWTGVEPMSPVRAEVNITPPEVCFATHPGLVSVRIQPADAARPGRQEGKSGLRQSMQEEVVDDHYAALAEAQRRKPVRAASPQPAVRAAQPPAKPQPPERQPASPDEAIEALLAVVEEAVDDPNLDDANVPASIPRREPAESETVRFHSLEEYVQSARQDVVRMDRLEPDATPAAHQSSNRSAAGPHEVDLYARLRRLQEVDP